jgi:hypothetical protein
MLKRLADLLAEARAEEAPFLYLLADDSTATLADVLTQPMPLGRCYWAGLKFKSDLAKGTSSQGHPPCRRFECSRCCPGEVSKIIRRTLHAWDGDPRPILRRRFSLQEWRSKSRAAGGAREFKAEHRNELLMLLDGYSGDCVVFFPGNLGDAGDEVSDPLGEIFEAVLALPARSAGSRRFQAPPIPKAEPDDDPSEPAEPEYETPRDKFLRPERIIADLPTRVPAWLGYQVLSGHSLDVWGKGSDTYVDGRLLVHAVHVDEGIEPVELVPSRGMLQQWGVEGLSREQNIRLRERLWPLREHYLAERRARIERNKASKRLAAEAAGAKLWADANF